MGERLIIRPAQLDELETVARLWNHAATWLHSRGINQWQYPARHEAITRNIAAGDECWLVEEDGKVIATISVDRHADLEFWRPEDDPEDALYAHRMVVVREAAGRELGSAMLDWTSLRAAAEGKSWLRLDVWKTNPDLQRYYASRGFALVRLVELPHRRSGALYQRPAGEVRGGCPDLREHSRAATRPARMEFSNNETSWNQN